jgi:hypothetical protein
MPRQRRVVLPGRPHHITQRGNNRRDVFFDDSDRELYLSLLREYTAQYQVKILGYCLMTNHVHLIAVPGAYITTTPAGFIFEGASPGIYGRTASFLALWRTPIPGQRSPMWSETRCALGLSRNVKNGLGAVPGGISA